MDSADTINRVIDDQGGIVSVHQLRSHGVSEEAIRWRLGRSWRMCLPGVVQTFTGPLPPKLRLVAAALYAGPDAALTGSAAARWYGLKAATSDQQLDFVTPRRRGAKAFAEIRVRRTLLTDPHERVDGVLRVSSPARSVADAARQAATQDRADALAIEAVQRCMVTIADLTHWLALGNQKGSRRVRLAIEAAGTGAWSVPEAELLALLSTSRVLPQAWANPALYSARGRRLLTPDLWFDPVGLAVMVHSRRHHFDVADWEATVAGDTGYAEHGITTLGFTPRMIRSRPQWVLGQVERTYLALKASGPVVTARAVPQRFR